MEEEDLKQLRTLNEEFIKTRVKLSDIVVTQSRLEKDRVALILDIENKAAKLSQIQAGLEEKYHFNIAFQSLIRGDAETHDQMRSMSRHTYCRHPHCGVITW